MGRPFFTICSGIITFCKEKRKLPFSPHISALGGLAGGITKRAEDKTETPTATFLTLHRRMDAQTQHRLFNADKLTRATLATLIWYGCDPRGDWEYDYNHNTRTIERLMYWKNSNRRPQDLRVVPLPDNAKSILEELLYDEVESLKTDSHVVNK